MSKRLVVLKVGGSFLLKEAGAPDVSEVREMAETVTELVKNNFKVIVVVGGGITARNYISAANQLGSSKGVLDHLGILVSRLNARVFIEALDNESLVHSEPAESLQEVRSFLQTRPVVVLGGLQPGQSTTAVAALCAEYCKAEKVIYGTDVDAVYTADPRKNPSAKKLDKISYSHLRDLTQTSDNILPGQYRIMDGVALTILERSNIPAQILMGSKENMLDSILKGIHVGTIICSSPNVSPVVKEVSPTATVETVIEVPQSEPAQPDTQAAEPKASTANEGQSSGKTCSSCKVTLVVGDKGNVSGAQYKKADPKCLVCVVQQQPAPPTKPKPVVGGQQRVKK